MKTAAEIKILATAFPIFLDYFQYEKSKIDNNIGDVKSYIGSIFSLSNSYSKNGNYEKSKVYSRLGLKECKKYNDYTHYTYLKMSEGIANVYLKNYQEAIKNLLFAEQEFIKNKDYENLAITYYFLGKANDQTQKEIKAIHYYLKTDSISFKINKFLPATRDGYERLIDYYKKKNDQEKQLKYINHLFHADSVILSNNKYISKDIYKKYDAPLLLQEKEQLVNELENKTGVLIWFLIGSLLIVTFLIFTYYRTKKRFTNYREQAEILLKKIKVENSNRSKKIRVKYDKGNKSTLSPENFQDIKVKISQFENNNGYIQNNLTLDILAKKLETNRDYLSKFINEEKGKSFSQYLNELRINYALLELKNNIKLRKYTISAIAGEVGFSNSESFSNAFKRITGTLPSYYIKLLEKDDAL